MSKRIAALIVITMLMLAVTGCTSSYGGAKKAENTRSTQTVTKKAAEKQKATEKQTEPPTEIETEPPVTTVSDGDTIELTGTVTVEEDNSSPSFTTYHAILNLDDPFSCYIVGLNYDGTKLYKIDSVQIPPEYRDRVGEHVTVTGEVMTAHTGHHLRDIVLV